ncbi:dienelactone hydrolase family protein [Erythrobacter sp. BLCC-B19]|uniref:dienelactone hydrolase family protein n=1 Tax=Erythrobacter sp. BLCC-B19 TaxID=3025315 RepID=UPI0023610915|nr:dienelactone hydrolase family protein [Erythrobacter sp. BLCC-B19]WDA42894.1 dienelactone hydrolase family protein [Erythrobacter sp. BLCC-B19]
MALERVDYADGEIALTGWLARPAGPARAAVAVYPTFMNTSPGVEAKAAALAEAGCVAFIADFYGPDAPHDFDSAVGAMGRLRADPLAMRRRLRATLETLADLAPGLPQIAIGFCLGGMAVLELARDGADLALAASFHGLLTTPLPATNPIAPRLLVCHGDADSLVPRADVIAFWEEMDAVGADWHFLSFAGVEHGFTNPLTPDRRPNSAYHRLADQQSWTALMGLIDVVAPAQS